MDFEERRKALRDEICKLTSSEREIYFSELRGILEIRGEARLYGLEGKAWVNLYPHEILKAEENLYKKIFGKQI